MGSIFKGIGNIFKTGNSAAERFARQQEAQFRRMEEENRIREAQYEQQRQEQQAMMNAQMAEMSQRQQEAENRQQTLLQLSQDNEQLFAEVEPGGGEEIDPTKKRKRAPISLASSLNIGV